MMGALSIPVDLAALGEELSRRDTTYLLISGESRPHVVQVAPELVDGALVLAEPVLHRPARPESNPSAAGCGSDCEPLTPAGPTG